MEVKKIEPVVETNIKYDDRKKEIIQTFKSIQKLNFDDLDVGEALIERKTTFNEQGIKKVMKDLNEQKVKTENTIKQIKNSLKDVPEISKELKELEEKIKAINDHNKNEQLISQITTQEKDLKRIKKDIADIKNAIGDRLKF